MMAEDTICRSRILVVDAGGLGPGISRLRHQTLRLRRVHHGKLRDRGPGGHRPVPLRSDHHRPQAAATPAPHGVVHAQHPGTRFIIMVQQRAQVQHVVYYEQVDIVFKPLSLDETVRKIRHALRQRQLRQAEDEFRRLKQEALRMFLS